MTYRDNSSDIKIPDIKTKNVTNLMLANKEMDSIIMQKREQQLLQDDPAVKSNQNVYDSLSE